MSRFVRQSKYRHVFGNGSKADESYGNLKVSKNAWDSNYIAVNPTYLAVCWEVGGGGAAAVIPTSTTGKLGEVFLFNGHSGPVLDVAFSPFDDSILATASEDSTVKIWSIPDGGLKSNVDTPSQVLRGHGRKCGTVNFNPVANNILATSSIDFKVKIWDIEKGSELFSIDGHAGIIQSVDWNYDGSLITTFGKDKKLRIIDPRQSTVVSEVDAHQGVKGGRAIFLGQKGKIFTTGFSKQSERCVAVWDPANFSSAVVQLNIDNSSGIIAPFFDDGSNVVFLAGKGDGNIRYYEVVEDDKVLYPLSQYSSTVPQQGVCALPKVGVDVNSNEIMRLYKATQNQVEPISFKVPRKSDVFQEDLFPDAPSEEPALTSSEWTSGKTSAPKLRSLQQGYVKKDKPKTEFTQVVETQTGPQTEAELRKEYEALVKRVAYLEAEVAKKDAIIKDLKK